MKTLAHLSDVVLRRELIAALARDRSSTAELLAHIAEFDARRLYVPEGYSSMHAYCVGELHLSEDAAYKRIQAARAAREFPALFEALAEGRLHLAAVCLLAPHLTRENVEELVAAATHRRKAEVEDLVARSTAAFGASVGTSQLAPGQVGSLLAPGDASLGGSSWCDLEGGEASNGTERNRSELAPGQVGGAAAYSFPPSERTYPLHLTVPESTHEKLAYAKALLSHAIPSGDVVQLLDRALDALIEKVEKRRTGAGSLRKARSAVTPRPAGNLSSTGRRYIAAHIRRAVWERDGGRCTFVSKSGHRCGERRFLEFDHVEPVSRGGKATVNGIRLRCRAHNQYEAEQILGAGFMELKRRNARLERAREEERRLQSIAREQTEDVIAGLRALGCRADQARRAAELSASEASTTLEARLRAALKFLGRRTIPAAPATTEDSAMTHVPAAGQGPSLTTAPPATFAAQPECYRRPTAP